MNVEKIRADFPVLEKNRIIYFDNACMSLRPRQVINAILEYYTDFPACAGRSLHEMAGIASEKMDLARKCVAEFIGAKKNELVFLKNTTEAINLVSNSLGLRKGDIVVSSDREHNSNLLPWQFLRKRKGITHMIIPSKKDEEFDLDAFASAISKKARLVSIAQITNLDSYTLPIREIIKISHENNSLVLIDGAQSAPHIEVNVKKLDADFFAFSAHKMCGPSGTGALYGKKELLEEMQPFIVGGSTVVNTTYKSAEMPPPPEKFEAGLQDIAGIIGFGAAAEYIKKIGLGNIEKHCRELNEKLDSLLKGIKKVSIVGVKNPEKRSCITSFNIAGLDSHDVSLLLDESRKIATRSGMHCNHAWFNSRKINGCVRASLYFYNTAEEVEIFAREVAEIAKHIA